MEDVPLFRNCLLEWMIIFQNVAFALQSQLLVLPQCTSMSSSFSVLLLCKKSLKLHFCLRDKISLALPCRAHCSKSSFFVQKFYFDFPRKLSIFWGLKTRETVVVLDFLAVDNFDFTRKIVKKNLGEKLVKMLGFCQN